MTPSSSSEQMNSPFTGTYGWSHVVPEQIHITHLHGFLKSELSVWLLACMTAQWNWKIQALQKDTDTGVLFYLLCISFSSHKIKKKRERVPWGAGTSLRCRGALIPWTVTVRLHVRLFPAASVAVYCTTVSPTGNREPGLWRLVTVRRPPERQTERWLFHFCWPFLVILLWKSIIIWTVQRTSIRWVKASCECETQTAVFRKCASYPTIHQ